MTIPQTNFRIGYFINDHYSIALGVDHMKYVTQNQVANITEYKYWIHSMEFHTPTEITENFLMYEHTDGLNYINTEFSET
jgi:hypothetical protein